MRTQALVTCSLLAALGCVPAYAASFNFEVLYEGDGIATLAPGSDDPIGQIVNPGDDFLWSITAQDDAFWSVDAGGNFFPFMAFYVLPEGTRTGDFTLTLRNDGVDVFTRSETGASNSFVHLGTNDISLDTGLVFDEMELAYLLQTSDVADTTIQGLLPIFGAPEMNPFSPGISYGVVPEPGTIVLSFLGLASIGCAARSRLVTRR